MILGLDLYDTLTKYPARYRELVYAVLADGGEVHVISAVKAGNKQRAERGAKKYNLEVSIHVLEYGSIHEAPRLKYEKCLELGVQLFIDDQQKTVEYLNQKKILALLSP